eukprot:4731473-Pyramimonas_sp.AAC.2
MRRTSDKHMFTSRSVRAFNLTRVQMRDREGFVETRRQLLTLKSGARVNWIAFAVAHHLAGSHELAVQVLDSYESTIDGDIPENEKYEHSEMVLYRATILEESGKVEEALACLDKVSENVVDKLSLLAQRANLYLKKGDKKAAEETYRTLIDINPDNHRYHEGLHAALDLVPSKRQLAMALRQLLTTRSLIYKCTPSELQRCLKGPKRSSEAHVAVSMLTHREI